MRHQDQVFKADQPVTLKAVAILAVIVIALLVVFVLPVVVERGVLSHGVAGMVGTLALAVALIAAVWQ